MIVVIFVISVILAQTAKGRLGPSDDNDDDCGGDDDAMVGFCHVGNFPESHDADDGGDDDHIEAELAESQSFL